MKKLHYQTEIKAPISKVYNTMLGLDNIKSYEQWTAEFNPTSTYEGNWNKGSKMLFVGTSEKGERGGMVSEIKDNIPNQFVSIRHYGMVQGDKEITTGPEIEQWAGGLEEYSFTENNGIITVKISIDMVEDYIDYFNDTWPKALQKLKEICEE